MIDALTRPMIDLLEECGTGLLPEGEQNDRLLTAGCDGLRTAASMVDRALTEAPATLGPAVSAVMSAGGQVLAAAGTAGGGSGSGWIGGAADAAASAAADAVRSAAMLAEHGEQLDAVLRQGLEAMRRAAARIAEVITSFVSAAAAMAPALATPAGPAALITLAIEHLGRATTIVGELRAELSTLTAQVVQLTEPPPTPPRPGGGGDPVAQLAGGMQAAEQLVSTGTRMFSGITEALGGGVGSPAGGAGAGVLPGVDTAGAGSPVDTGSAGSTSGSAEMGPGSVTVTLPDGSTATAPNEAAAQAVRSALTQQGVPYQWGGTTPGSGLDCSGLTQWAYGEAGIDIPRLAQEQSVGTAVSADGLQPGDLAVWDGHVAMVIGNGQMIEAGDPVSVSDIRTTNSGMAFHGFYRPTT
ncbi:C40 family peptidase [Millisia brevis]|uniref:C40 family peptidase n=1 Tax=Millisia brevis TaxID=264148 RepID=UPI000832415F|nr:C40 family peptidase [Millisia brevis]